MGPPGANWGLGCTSVSSPARSLAGPGGFDGTEALPRVAHRLASKHETRAPPWFLRLDVGPGDGLRPSPVPDPGADGSHAGSQRKAECVADRSMQRRIAKWRGFPLEGPCARDTGFVGGETSTSPQRPGRVTAMGLNDRTGELLLRPMAAMLIDQTGLGTTVTLAVHGSFCRTGWLAALTAIETLGQTCLPRTLPPRGEAGVSRRSDLHPGGQTCDRRPLDGSGEGPKHWRQQRDRSVCAPVLENPGRDSRPPAAGLLDHPNSAPHGPLTLHPTSAQATEADRRVPGKLRRWSWVRR